METPRCVDNDASFLAQRFGVGKHGLGYKSNHVKISNHVFVKDIDKKVQRMGVFGFANHLCVTNTLREYRFIHNALLTVHKDMGTGSIGFLEGIQYVLNLPIKSIPQWYIFRREGIQSKVLDISLRRTVTNIVITRHLLKKGRVTARNNEPL